MKKITIEFTIVNRTGNNFMLTGIDMENKQIQVTAPDAEGNMVDKIVTFSTCKNYKVMETGKNLNEKLLTELEAAIPVDLDPETIPQGYISRSLKPDADNPNMMYIEDLAAATGYKAKFLRKKLRKMEAEDIIVKEAHTWCWDKNTNCWTDLINYILSTKSN